MIKTETIFQKELSLIHDKDIKQFVITCFDKLCPDYFWTCPCSTTGKYHPQVSLGVGGLVRHTKLAVWWGIELLKAMQFEGYRDEIIATLLLHDMVKNGKGLNAKGYPLDRGVTGTHGVTLATEIFDDGYDTTMVAWQEKIYYGIACHMGIWTTNPEFRPQNMCSTLKPFVDLIHLADYCASRKVDEIYSELTKEKNADVVDATCKNCKENCNDTTKIPITKKETSPCPGVRETESQTTTEANSQ